MLGVRDDAARAITFWTEALAYQPLRPPPPDQRDRAGSNGRSLSAQGGPFGAIRKAPITSCSRIRAETASAPSKSESRLTRNGR